MKKSILTWVLAFSTMIAFAQETFTGKVIDGETNDPLAGATVMIKGTSTGVIVGFNGNFSINGPAGSTLVVSYLGYGTVEVAGGQDMMITMMTEANQLGEIILTSSVIDIAKERETPVAVSTIAPAEIALKVGNLEFPEIMNRTPGVYATKESGGYGDSRISLRGFDQRNTSFLINGQPVNDMENGWVYWSNWQGLTDVASGIQLQRGLGASRLAVPSVGGTVSIFTKAAELQAGGSVAQTAGNDEYYKTSVNYNTGKNDKGWASSILLSRWSGDGYVDNTSGEGWTYFFAVGYAPNDSNHAFNFSLLGAAQWHHQRSSWVSIRDFQNFGDTGEIDPRWNTDGGLLNGKEYNIRRNFYNKPLVTFNWDWQISSNVTLATSLYGSAGRGGGTGPRGNNFRNGDIDMYPFNIDLTEHYLENGRGTRLPNRQIDYDAVVNTNRATTLPYSGPISAYDGLLIGSNGFRDDNVNRAIMIRRASMNSHDWVGAISSLDITSERWRYSIGVDLRSYKGYHYRALNDLLGLDGYYSTGDRNTNGKIVETRIKANPMSDTGISGPKIDYFNIGYVGWQGVNGLIEYNDNSQITAVLQAGISNQSFQREDLFDQPTLPLSEKKNLTGGYVKGGANYNINSKSNVFFNAGYISRQPLFDAVFPNFANLVNPDLQNEQIVSFELGYGYVTNDFKLNVNAYSTSWGNRFVSRGITNTQGADGTAQFKDISVLHQGIELEGTYDVSSQLRLRGMISMGDWRYTKDFSAALFDNNNQQIGTGTLYTKDAKVGDAAQFTSFFEADYRIGRTSFDLGFRFIDGLYADYSITDSDFLQPDNQGALKLPSYALVDLGGTTRFTLFGKDSSLRVNVNNLFNTTYIAESNSNIHATSGSDTWKGIDTRNYVWFGFGTTWNATFKINL